jgi:hypothetical protein
LTSTVTKDGGFIGFHEGPETQTIEKGPAETDLIIGKGTDFEFYASVDGKIFLIPGQIKHLTTGNEGLEFNVSLLGQGISSANNKLTITIAGEEQLENSFYKWTFVYVLNKD